MDAKTPVQVTIFGHSYTIRGETDQAYVLEVAAYVDGKQFRVYSWVEIDPTQRFPDADRSNQTWPHR